jgi:hypothetical protein
MSRSTCQIQVAVQEADPNISDEELRLCIEAQRNMEYFYQSELLGLIEAIRQGKPANILRMKAEFAWGTHERMFAAAQKPPAEWLGPDNIPGSLGQREKLAWAKKVFKKVTGEDL